MFVVLNTEQVDRATYLLNRLLNNMSNDGYKPSRDLQEIATMLNQELEVDAEGWDEDFDE
jgi:hypothetical protein